MSDKLDLLRAGIPTEIALLIAIVALAAIASIVMTSMSRGPGNERSLRITAIVLCVFGLGIALSVAYTAVILKEIPPCFEGGGGCAVVETSSYSHLFGIHVSVFGIIGYVLILTASILRGDRARVAAFILSLFGFGFSLYLTYLELWEILAICQWCIGSAVLMTLLFAVNTTRMIKFFGLDQAVEEAVEADEPALD